MFDQATTGQLLALIDRSPVGTPVDVVVSLAEPLAWLPVELLRLPEDRRLLATIAGVRVTRRLAGIDRAPVGPLPGPLKILAAVAAPEETQTGNGPVDVEAEMQALLDAVTDTATGDQAQVRILEVASSGRSPRPCGPTSSMCCTCSPTAPRTGSNSKTKTVARTSPRPASARR